MPDLADFFTTLHFVLLSGFVSVAALLMLVTICNRRRIEHVMLTWRTGRVGGLPIWPSLFIGLVLVFLACALATDQPLHPAIFAGYVAGGICWFVAVYLSQTVFVTECGLVADVNHVRGAVSWGEVIDYFDASQDASGRAYVFLYRDADGQRRRFEVSVPAHCEEQFRAIVTEKLDLRFDLAVQEVENKKALEE